MRPLRTPAPAARPAALPAARPAPRRFHATEDGRVICDLGGAAYLACSVLSGVYDRGDMAQLVAEALNRPQI